MPPPELNRNADENGRDSTSRTGVVYDLDDLPPIKEAVPLGLQHVLAMFLSNIAVPLIVATAVGLNAGEKAFLVQMALLMAGISTIVQSYPLGPVGARVPIVMGTSFAFVAALISVIQQFNLAAAFGACLVAAAVEVVIGFTYQKFRKYFPPLATGIVVMLIGLSLIRVGVDYSAGGLNAPDYGSFENLGLAGLVFLLTVFLNQFTKGFVSYASMIIAVVIGYVAALFLGLVDVSTVTEGGWFALPQPFRFGIEFHWAPILIMSFIYVISALETIGDITGTMAAVQRDPEVREMRGGLVADGVMSGFAALFGAFPNTSYSQNVGLVNFTGIISRHVAAIGGGFLVLLGLIPKVGVLVATIPPPVIGGAALVMFGMIFASGLAIVHRGVAINKRNMVIIAVSLALGLGVEFRPDILTSFPEVVKSFLGQGLVVGGFAGFLLNLVFPEKPE